MTIYDLMYLNTKGYIDTDPDSQTFANLTINVTDLNFFASDETCKKLSYVHERAKPEKSGNENTCLSVLQELLYICDPLKESCTSPNIKTFQVSVEQVCASRNTREKLFEVIGDAYNGFVDLINGKLHLSFDKFTTQLPVLICIILLLIINR